LVRSGGSAAQTESTGASDERIARRAGITKAKSAGYCHRADCGRESRHHGDRVAGIEPPFSEMQNLCTRRIWKSRRDVLDGSARDHGRMAGSPYDSPV